MPCDPCPVYKLYFDILSVLEESYPIKSVGDLFDATQEIRRGRMFCEYLGVGKEVLEEIEYRRKSDSEKKHDCLTEYYNNHNPNWRKVFSVLYNFPFLRNLPMACNIAMKYMKMEKDECIKQFERELTVDLKWPGM